MHPDTEELLSVADGSAEASIRTHVSQCASCREALSALERQSARLRSLPTEDAPSADPRLFAAVPALASPAGPARGRPFALAAAVSLAAVVALWIVGGVSHQQTAGQTPDAAVPPVQQMARDDTLSPDAAATVANAALRDRSAELERTWRSLTQGAGRVQRLSHSERANRLKARVSLLDASYDQLPEDDYWQRRVDLLDALVAMERAERLARYPSYNVMRNPAQLAPARLN